MTTTTRNGPFAAANEELAARRLRAERAREMFGDQAPNPMKIGHFTLKEQLGEGGQGSVFVAHDAVLDREVALKRLHSVEASKREALHEEAKTLARFQHPNVVTVHEVVFDPIEGPFIVMERVNGEPLHRWLNAKRRTCAEIVGVLIQVGRGLAALHDQRVVHRDVKPENVMIEQSGRAKLVDLGIAFHTPDPTLGVTTQEDTASRGIGTPGYMAPEQVTGQPLDARTDQYSFCVVAHEALYGHRPSAVFSSDLGHGKGPARGTDSKRQGARIPRGLRRIVERGLQAEAAQRFGSMAELVHALEQWERSRRRRPLVLGTAGALVLGTGLAVALWPRAESPCSREQTAAMLWSEPTRDEVRETFKATASPMAGPTFSVVDTLLTDYASELDTTYGDACASLADTESAPGAAHARLACLSRAQGVLADLVGQLGTLSADELPHATEHLSALPVLASCSGAGTIAESCDPGQVVPGYTEQVRAVGLKLQAAEARITLGRYDEGLALADEAIELSQPQPLAQLRGRAWLMHGRLAYEAQEFHTALTSLEQAVSLAEQQACDGVAAEALTLMAKVRALQPKGDAEEALRWSQQALDKLERLGDTGPRLADALNSRGLVLHMRLQRYEEADALYREAAKLRDRFLPSTALALSDTLLNRGAVLANLDRLDEAIAVLERALTLRSEALGPDHPGLYKLHVNLGSRLLEHGDVERAEASFERSLELAAAGFGSEHRKLGDLHLRMAAALDRQRAFEVALVHGRRALEIYGHSLSADDLRWIDAWGALGQIYLDSNRAAQAVPWATKAWEFVREHPQSKPMERALGAYRVGSAEHASGRSDEAIVWFDRALGLLAHDPADDGAAPSGQSDELRAFIQLDRGEALNSIGRFAQAVESLEAAMVWWDEHPGNPERLALAQWGLAQSLLASDAGADTRARSDELSIFARSYFAGQADGDAWRSRIDRWRDENGLSAQRN